MRFLSKTVSTIGVTAALLAGFAIPAVAAETASSDLVIIQEDVVITDDLYATGLRVLIEGKVVGDLVAFAAEDVVIEGEVTGSVLVIARDLTVSGVVGGSLRAGVTSIEVSGSVGRDVVVTSFGALLGESAIVDGDVLFWAFDAVSRASVGGDLTGTARDLEMQGSVAGDVDVTVSRLSVSGPFHVGGDLGYRSEDEAAGLDQVDTGGVIVHETPLPPNIRVRALALLARLLIIVGLTVVALLIAWAWPRRTESAAEALVASPARAYGIGLVVMLSPVLLAAAAGLVLAVAPASAALPLLAIFAPLVLALAGLVFALSLVAGVPTVLTAGRWFPADLSPQGSVLAGSVVAGVAWLAPVVGWLVPAIVLPIGIGSWVLGARRVDRLAEVDAEVLQDQA
jgi:cytoskeletal protein CcmA (bactofilin family)